MAAPVRERERDRHRQSQGSRRPGERSGLDAWRTRALADVDAIYLYLDALALRVRSAGKVVSVPVLGVVAVLTDGQKQLVALELCAGGESFEAWKGCLEDLVSRGLPAPVLCIIDGHAGLRRAVERTWPGAAVQRCCVHKLRNLERKAPKHALAELREDFHRIVYATSGEAARAASSAFERQWATRCPGVVRSLHEGGDERLTFFRFPPAQWKTLRTTNVIERLRPVGVRCDPTPALPTCPSPLARVAHRRTLPLPIHTTALCWVVRARAANDGM